jgi:F-type H+-transporting ATPase subunit b
MTINWWSLGLQAVNVLILVFALDRLFWRPIVAVITARKVQARALMDEADAKAAEAKQALEEVAAIRAGFAAERDAILANARADAEAARRDAMSSARKDVAALRKAADEAVAKSADAARRVQSDKAVALAMDIAKRLAGRLTGPEVDAAFQKWLIDSIAALPPETRTQIAQSEGVLALTTAAPLSADHRKRLLDKIAKALGATPEITFHVDPSLIAGCELHGAHLTLDNSWRADLARLSEALTDAG